MPVEPLLDLLLAELVVPLLLRNLLAVLQLIDMATIAVQVGGPMVAVSGIGIAIGRLMEARQARAMRGAMLREGLCPTCAYELRSLEEGEDGATLCPECGGRWALPAVEVEPESEGDGEAAEVGAGAEAGVPVLVGA